RKRATPPVAERLAASARMFWRPRLDALELAGLGVLGTAAAALAAGAVKAPLAALVLVVAGAWALVFLARTDVAILFVVATAPIEGEWASGPAGIPLTKFAGGLCLASFAFTIARDRRRRLVLEPGQALVFGILGLALLSTLHA